MNPRNLKLRTPEVRETGISLVVDPKQLQEFSHEISIKLHGNAKNLTGQRFGRLVAVEATEKRSSGSIVWKCLCDCGKECFVQSCHLKSGATKSCGCLVLETQTIHGMCYTKIYKIWTSMIQRCDNPKDANYKNYGGRGISVCERWHKFENFYADVGDPPMGMTLDRYPDNDGNYEFTNGPARQRWFYGHGPNGEMIIENDQSYVAKVFGLQSQNISNCLHGRQKTHKGWTFKRIPGKQEEAIYD